MSCQAELKKIEAEAKKIRDRRIFRAQLCSMSRHVPRYILAAIARDPDLPPEKPRIEVFDGAVAALHVPALDTLAEGLGDAASPRQVSACAWPHAVAHLVVVVLSLLMPTRAGRGAKASGSSQK